MNIQVEFIYQPIGGHYQEKHFDIPRNDFKIRAWSWLLFTKSNGTNWTASFCGGENDKCLAATLKDTPYAFIVSHGQGYLVNVDTEDLLKYTNEDNIRELKSASNRSLVLFADTNNIYAIDKSLEITDLDVPFEFYFVWFKQVSDDTLQIEYEEIYTGDFKTAYLDTKSLKFNTHK
jgi:hypothetical protein